MSLHREIHFEDEICQSLAAAGWLYDPTDAASYDRQNAVFLPDLMAWLEVSQPDNFEHLRKSHGPAMPQMVATRVRDSLNRLGTLEVLRRGVEMVGLKRPLSLVQFKPSLGMNPELERLYAANRLRVLRQVRHSLNNAAEAIDLVLFVNGIAVATSELKSDFTQSVEDAVNQYRFDREPHPKGGLIEPLLAFPGGALVHFAVSQDQVMMTTKLSGASTFFLPFNKGDNGGAGNPANPDGFKTAYLWEEVWARDSWLDILSRYLIGQRDDKKNLKTYIFPRYHQLDATRKLVADIRENGAGGRYLIQHSAGSGKTNSIAWSAHFLADLHDAEQNKMFDSVIVVSDRTVLDAQLQEAIFDFQRTKGVVATISTETGSKSGQLSQALKDGKKIIVCTIQTFPFALEAVKELSATEGKRFAVIADEAHSSQTGQAASKLKMVLSSDEQAELADGGEISAEDYLLAAQMSARAAADGLTYVAFTATPKGKTLELFGRKDADGQPQPFHVYSMRQAIEEGFILDVLQNYTSYKLAYRLAHNGEEWDDTEVERKEAVKGLNQWVRLHPYNIAQKVQTVVEHYRSNVQPLLDGKAKAMVVVGSRKEAVRWQKAIRGYIERQGYSLGCLVAFSGEIDDKESYPEPVSEVSKELNPGLRGRDLRDVFAGEDYHLLLVANKYQTGFDQPKLCGMYVDKKLGGIQAVQTLSRLNRAHPTKDTTYVLDFANDAGEILKAFKTYYETAEIETTTDPNMILNLRAKLDAQGHYDSFEVDRVVAVELNPKGTQAQLSAAIAPVADRLLKRFSAAKSDYRAADEAGNANAAADAKGEMEALTMFKGDMQSFVRAYAFLSQMFDYGNTDIEKRFLFYKRLIPLLDFGRERDTVDLSKVVLTHHSLRNQGRQPLDLRHGESEKLKPMDAVGSGAIQDKDRALLNEIIEKVNSLFQGELTDDDQLIYVNGVLKGKLLENETLIQQATNNTKEQFANSPDLTTALMNAIMDALDAHQVMSTQALGSARVREGLKDTLLGPGQLYEALRNRVGNTPPHLQP